MDLKTSTGDLYFRSQTKGETGKSSLDHIIKIDECWPHSQFCFSLPPLWLSQILAVHHKMQYYDCFWTNLLHYKYLPADCAVIAEKYSDRSYHVRTKRSEFHVESLDSNIYQ